MKVLFDIDALCTFPGMWALALDAKGPPLLLLGYCLLSTLLLSPLQHLTPCLGSGLHLLLHGFPVSTSLERVCYNPHFSERCSGPIYNVKLSVFVPCLLFPRRKHLRRLTKPCLPLQCHLYLPSGLRLSKTSITHPKLFLCLCFCCHLCYTTSPWPLLGQLLPIHEDSAQETVP